MNRTPVVSSNIVAIGYDSSSRTLEIEFRGGKVYRYLDIPSELYEALISARSIGKYFASEIRDFYSYARVR